MEIWKDIYGYEGLYQISNYGNVKSVNRKVKNKHGFRIVKDKILKPILNNKGYYIYGLRKNGKLEMKLLHRLIAENFIENKNNYPCINHIDGNKLNNNINNLEWCSYQHNIKEAFRIGLNNYTFKNNFKHDYWKGKYGKNHNCSKAILQYDKKGCFIKEWESITEASKETNINYYSISNNCRGKQKSAGDFVWKFKEENNG